MSQTVCIEKDKKILATGTILENLENTVSVPWRGARTRDVGFVVLARTTHAEGAYQRLDDGGSRSEYYAPTDSVPQFPDLQKVSQIHRKGI